jgi:hypothetical protein
LTASIAHEINQPLAAVVTNGHFCLRRLSDAPQNIEELREAIGEIVNDGTYPSECHHFSYSRAVEKDATSNGAAG